MDDWTESTFRNKGFVQRLDGSWIKPGRDQVVVHAPAGKTFEYEDDLHDAILEECKQRGWICLHGSMAHRTHRTIAEPDCVILADRGRCFLVEAKSKSGKPSPKQLALKAWAKKLGHVIHIVRTMEEFRALLG